MLYLKAHMSKASCRTIYVPSCQWNKAFPIKEADAVGDTVDHGFVGINVDVCSGATVVDCVCVTATVDEARVSSCKVSDAGSWELYCDVCVAWTPTSEVEGVSEEESTCHDQIHPVFVGSTEQTMSDVQVRMVFH